MINYKKVISSRNMRVKIMQILSFLPDVTVVKIQYYIKTGRILNLKNPLRYTEKLQWYKLFYRNDLMAKCVDKYEVRDYVKSKGLESILVPIIGIYDSVDDICFEELPESFVIKDTLGGGGNSVIIIKNKSNANWQLIKENMSKWLYTGKTKHPGREWVYDGRKSKILIEQYIDSNPEEGGLIDYKFFFFNGDLACVYGIADRVLGKEAGFGIFDKEFNILPYTRTDEKPLMRELKKPSNYSEMVSIAKHLAEDFPHARIDLYNQNGVIRFGEITFFDGSGYMIYDPDEYDFILGEKFKLPKRNH